jgi:hypothetical protein
MSTLPQMAAIVVTTVAALVAALVAAVVALVLLAIRLWRLASRYDRPGPPAER